MKKIIIGLVIVVGTPARWGCQGVANRTMIAAEKPLCRRRKPFHPPWRTRKNGRTRSPRRSVNAAQGVIVSPDNRGTVTEIAFDPGDGESGRFAHQARHLVRGGAGARRRGAGATGETESGAHAKIARDSTVPNLSSTRPTPTLETKPRTPTRSGRRLKRKLSVAVRRPAWHPA